MDPDSDRNPHCSCVFLNKRDMGDLRKGLRSLWESKICKEWVEFSIERLYILGGSNRFILSN